MVAYPAGLPPISASNTEFEARTACFHQLSPRLAIMLLSDLCGMIPLYAFSQAEACMPAIA
jgi:hypothetical protein